MEPYKIIRSRKVRPVPSFWNGISQTGFGTAVRHGACISKLWMIFQNGHLTMVYPTSDWQNVGHALLSRTIEQPSYIPTVYAEQVELGKLLVRHSRRSLTKDLETCSLGNLLAKLRKLKTMWLQYDMVNVLPWHVMGDYLRDYLSERLLEIDGRITNEDFLLLMTPPSKSFNLAEDLACHEVALRFKHYLRAYANRKYSEELREAPELLNRQVERLAREFGWIPFGYDGPDIWDATYYRAKIDALATKEESEMRKRIKEIRQYDSSLEKKQQEIRHSIGISANVWRLIKDFHTVSEMTNERKQYSYQAHISIIRIMKHMARLLDVDLQSMAHLTDTDIAEFGRKRNQLIAIATRRQTEPFVFEFKEGDYDEIEDEEARNLIREITPTSASEDSVQGEVASWANRLSIVGMVRVLNSVEELSQMKDGEVLVSSMTTPEFVPAMRIAAAVVTDEGGVTCHAAIVSRELGIPCMIGTGRATKVFHNGDFVEINLDRRIVRKITKDEYYAKYGQQMSQPRIAIQGTQHSQISSGVSQVDRQSDALILALTEIGQNDSSLVGGKAANLGELIGSFPVPAGFCLTVNIYDQYIRHNDLGEPINKAMRSLDASDLNELTEVSREINGLFLKGEIPEQLSDAILSRYHELGGPVAVRSSGVAEDRPGASFAGQHESFLNVDNDESLLLAIKMCWASLFSSRALSYRAYLEKDEDNMEMAILIQEMVDAEISGVMFTVNPIVSAPEILIEAFYGLGESVVSGRVTPERYTVDKLNGRIKTVKFTPNRRPSKNDAKTGRLAANESARRNGQILSAEQVGELSQIGTKLENHFGCAQDIEWAIKAKEFYIIQSRPVLPFPNQ